MYDISKKYTAECALTLSGLCHELMVENKHPEGGAPIKDEAYYRDKFKNSDKTGLLDKLQSKLDFDMEKLSEHSRVERFDMLKILKLLFYIEKSGQPKYKSGYSDVRIQITDILAKPRLANIYTEYSNISVYGDAFDSLFQSVKSIVADADLRESRFERIDAYWDYIVGKLFDFVITDKALENPDAAIAELERINKFLNLRLLKKLQDIKPQFLSSPEGLSATFFNILLSHKRLCSDVNRININYELCIDTPPDTDYVESFKKTEKIHASWDFLDELEGSLSFSQSGIMDKIWALITYARDIEHEDVKHYRYAIKHARTVASWIEQNTGISLSDGIGLDMLIIIIQEIFHIKKHGDKVVDDYYGYNNRFKSLLTALTKPDTTTSVVKQAWIKKLENRTAVNFGAHKLICKQRETETIIYKIKLILYSYRNLDDLDFVNVQLSHFAGRSLMSREMAMIRGNLWWEKVYSFFPKSMCKNIQMQVWPEAISVLDMFREFYIDKCQIEDLVAQDVANKIIDIYNESDETVVGRGNRTYFEVYFSEKYNFDFMFDYFIDRCKNTFQCLRFFQVCSDDEISRMEELGLGKFVIK